MDEKSDSFECLVHEDLHVNPSIDGIYGVDDLNEDT